MELPQESERNSIQIHCTTQAKYASTAWDPYTNKDKLALERVQRKAARFCSKNYNPMSSVTDMIKDLNWESLEVRRKKARLTLLYKFFRSLVDVETNNYLLVNNETRTRGSYSYKYRVPQTTKDVFKFSFFPRTIREWNLLPEEIVCSENLLQFRNNISNSF